MRRRIWAALLLASDQEISDGLAFYPGAHGLCRLFALSHPPLTVRHIAGMYAALSPMNTWDTNVSNILDLLRDWSAASVNTTDNNFHKALRIRCGEDPEKVLWGRKVRAFFRAIADPEDQSIAIDRHLINLAMGLSSPTKREQADMAHDDTIYSRIESVYQSLGQREGLGNRLASIAWFVQRRIERTGQLAHPSAHYHDTLPLCCDRPMQSWGHKPRRWYCCLCRSTRRPERCPRLVRQSSGVWEERTGVEGCKLWTNRKGRRCITLHPLHPYANRGGWQYLARFLMAESLGYLPPSNEHTHHENGNLQDDCINNLELVSVEYHGQLHASALFVGRGVDGRFIPLDPSDHPPPGGVVEWPRYGPILGNRAKESSW